MTTYAERVASAPDIKAALSALAEGLDELLGSVQAPQPADSWAWSDAVIGGVAPASPSPATASTPAVAGPLPVTTETEDTVTVDLPPASPELQAARREYAARLQLALFQSPPVTLSEEEFIHAYAVGGPLWFYYGDREGVLGLPIEVRRAMVNEVEQLSPQLAAEVARDLLMYRGAQDQSNVPALNVGEPDD